MGTGAVSPCGNPIMNDSQPTKAACPLQHCHFATKGASWVCCQCHQGPNTQGWCTQKLTAQQVGIDPRAAGELQATQGSGAQGTEYLGSWNANYYESASSPSSSSDGANTWVASPASSKASSDSGSDRRSSKSSGGSKKHTVKKSSLKKR
ncbi:hypothetical protein LLEC1_00593 [Akanthomyces lecanii]|uniref:Uncharacterized protein n=1 Tax=Cordyceps confragosa TaxID=2714763 RepID=A0A179IBZ5_CORDF|nr:hypothetical protein LLEC1_00593 [Akanthomyces lecanii]